MTHYVLDADGDPVGPVEPFEWALWWERHYPRTEDEVAHWICRVAHTVIGDARVSTVFLGIDHDFAKTGTPILYETMAFNADGEYMCRHRNRHEALAYHDQMVATLRDRLRA